jgi:hypothetical protein
MDLFLFHHIIERNEKQLLAKRKPASTTTIRPNGPLFRRVQEVCRNVEGVLCQHWFCLFPCSLGICLFVCSGSWLTFVLSFIVFLHTEEVPGLVVDPVAGRSVTDNGHFVVLDWFFRASYFEQQLRQILLVQVIVTKHLTVLVP